MQHDRYLSEALTEARQGLSEGGIPIGAVLVDENGEILGRGHNRRVQRGSTVLHAEMDALENAGRLPAAVYKRSTMYTTLSPCDMCSGACLLYGIPTVVLGENKTFTGGEAQLQSRNVKIVNLDNSECKDLMAEFIKNHPELWNEDIGE